MKTKEEITKEIEVLETKMRNERIATEYDKMMAAKDALGWVVGFYESKPSDNF